MESEILHIVVCFSFCIFVYRKFFVLFNSDSSLSPSWFYPYPPSDIKFIFPPFLWFLNSCSFPRLFFLCLDPLRRFSRFSFFPFSFPFPFFCSSSSYCLYDSHFVISQDPEIAKVFVILWPVVAGGDLSRPCLVIAALSAVFDFWSCGSEGSGVIEGSTARSCRFGMFLLPFSEAVLVE